MSTQYRIIDKNKAKFSVLFYIYLRNVDKYKT